MSPASPLGLPRSWPLGAQLVGDLTPLGPGGHGVVLGEGVADEGGDEAPALFLGARQGGAHEVELT